MVLILQIIYIQNKTLNPCFKRGLEQRHEDPNLSQESFYSLALTSKREEAPGMRLHKV